MQGTWRPMSTFFERGWPAKVARMGRRGQDARAPLGRLPILTMRADCSARGKQLLGGLRENDKGR
eukprot:1012854-Pyramimonas_sp.AAC.1